MVGWAHPRRAVLAVSHPPNACTPFFFYLLYIAVPQDEPPGRGAARRRRAEDGPARQRDAHAGSRGRPRGVRRLLRVVSVLSTIRIFSQQADLERRTLLHSSHSIILRMRPAHSVFCRICTVLLSGAWATATTRRTAWRRATTRRRLTWSPPAAPTTSTADAALTVRGHLACV